MVGITGFGVSGALNARRAAMDPPAKPEAAAVDTSRGYPVGNGSFSSQVRGTSPQPELDLQFALMANDAYRLNATGPTGTQSERELAEAGWTRLTPVGNGLVDAQGHQIPIAPNLLHDPKTGFDAAIYQNEQGQYVVAYRGTDNWSPGEGGDAMANGGQGLGLSTRQYEQAIRLAERAEKVFGEGNVAITGHSLGGGLASPELHIARVQARVAAGGHAIPETKIRERWTASIAHLIALLPDLAEVRVFDNSTSVAPGESVPDPVPVARIARGRLMWPQPTDWQALRDTPDWAKPVVEATWTPE